MSPTTCFFSATVVLPQVCYREGRVRVLRDPRAAVPRLGATAADPLLRTCPAPRQQGPAAQSAPGSWGSGAESDVESVREHAERGTEPRATEPRHGTRRHGTVVGTPRHGTRSVWEGV